MLVELRVKDLGVVAEARMELTPGMTVLTGETGAGKTLLVEALGLLLGGRADASVIRHGATEALVEAVFDEPELCLSRAVVASGRSRATIDGGLATVSMVAGMAGAQVDLYGQHSHQSLLDAATQRGALDEFAGVDLTALAGVRQELRRIEAEMAELGGSEEDRARMAEMLSHEIAEIDRAQISSPDEEEALREQEHVLANLAAYRMAASKALESLLGVDGLASGGAAGAADLVGEAYQLVQSNPSLGAYAQKLALIQQEIADVATSIRRISETWDDDPERLDQVRERLNLFGDLKRRYGGSLPAVLDYAEGARAREAELRGATEQALRLQALKDAMGSELAREERRVHEMRSSAAPELAKRVEAHLERLAMPGASFSVSVGADPPGDDVTFMLAANPGEPPRPLAKVASGGELARVMLAMRRVLSHGPPTMIFDEVDAGVAGVAAVEVGKDLAALARSSQVLVVTHLAQVAAYADRHFVVRKELRAGRTASRVEEVRGEDRVVELARMLAGRPGSKAARQHAEELLASCREAW